MAARDALVADGTLTTVRNSVQRRMATASSAATTPGIPTTASESLFVMDESLPPRNRFHTNGDYARAFNRQQKAAGRYVVVLINPRSRRSGGQARLGVMIPNKAVKTAVRRHQLKRWVRELFRRQLKERLNGHDAVVLFRSNPPEDSHRALDDEIIHLVPKALAASAGAPRGGRGPRRS